MSDTRKTDAEARGTSGWNGDRIVALLSVIMAILSLGTSVAINMISEAGENRRIELEVTYASKKEAIVELSIAIDAIMNSQTESELERAIADLTKAQTLVWLYTPESVYRELDRAANQFETRDYDAYKLLLNGADHVSADSFKKRLDLILPLAKQKTAIKEYLFP